ncbi:acyl-CoA synthetase family member 2, mitochondrial [Caerostris extrusa]|uniref:Medium-chain acyl-CoA ligase ACSF2, mitochondrial n=1 Tax=Caerostris extrusa TaxID=172846 RepID=A0AAV4T0X6_CAEEX|nr:acyl-CoA synthetase family member 2, mitochondrial [Caerostris extrusa]
MESNQSKPTAKKGCKSNIVFCKQLTTISSYEREKSSDQNNSKKQHFNHFGNYAYFQFLLSRSLLFETAGWLIAYGSTENSPAVAVSGVDEELEKSVKGMLKPVEYVELKIVDNNGKVVSVNTEGKLCVWGHNLFLGYWNEPEKSTEDVDKSSWYRTG